MPEIWWKERIRLWPFSVLLAPDTIRNEFEMETRLGAINCTHFENFTDLANRSGLVLDKDFWRTLIETDPSRYSDCSTTIKALPAIQEACVSGWLSMIEDDQITLKSIQSIPDFVKKHKVIQEAFRINLPSSFRKAVRVFPSSLHARENRFDIQSVLPAASEESKSLACERMVSTLLNNLDGVFSDEKFVDAVRQRADFSCLREQAWTEAIQAQPPLWFALPPDLKSKPDFQLIDSDIPRVDITAWCTKITQKPWLLTQQNGVPKSIRLHKSIIYAYREGWLPHLKKSPWRLWLPTKFSRVYMSNGLLADEHVIYALTDGWKLTKGKVVSDWFLKPSERMREIPAIQVSVLLAICPQNLAGLYPNTIKICLDIDTRFRRISNQTTSTSPIYKKIQSLLALRGIGCSRK